MKKILLGMFGVLLFVSCSSDDSNTSTPKNNSELTAHLNEMDKTYYSFIEDPSINNQDAPFMAFNKHHVSHFDIINENHHSLVDEMINTNDYNKVFETMYNEGLVNEIELKLLNDFTTEATNTKNIKLVVDKYKQIFIENNLYKKYEDFFIGFNSLNEVKPELFKQNVISTNGYVTYGFFSSCAGASVGLALGFAGLAAGGASVVGAGIGAAAFIYASMQWGEACR